MTRSLAGCRHRSWWDRMQYPDSDSPPHKDLAPFHRHGILRVLWNYNKGLASETETETGDHRVLWADASEIGSVTGMNLDEGFDGHNHNRHHVQIVVSFSLDYCFVKFGSSEKRWYESHWTCEMLSSPRWGC